MAWEIRTGRRVYYRSRRVGRRVVRDYFGGGPEAHLAAGLDASDAAMRCNNGRVAGPSAQPGKRRWRR